MKLIFQSLLFLVLATGFVGSLSSLAAADAPVLKLKRDKKWLIISGDHLPGGEIKINYLEAYCRANSTNADWSKHTVIKHTSELISSSEDGLKIKLKDTLVDGVTVLHEITASGDEVDFKLTAVNPTKVKSEAHWAQPCIRIANFTGVDEKDKNLEAYLPKAFIFLEGKLVRMSDIKLWAKEARYVPGQVWCPKGVPRKDVNPRPLSPLIPSNGLIGAYSKDETMIFATAFEPYQELFQGVAHCLHADFRLGGLNPGEKKIIKGKIYLLKNDIDALLKRYKLDFPSHQ